MSVLDGRLVLAKVVLGDDDLERTVGVRGEADLDIGQGSRSAVDDDRLTTGQLDVLVLAREVDVGNVGTGRLGSGQGDLGRRGLRRLGALLARPGRRAHTGRLTLGADPRRAVDDVLGLVGPARLRARVAVARRDDVRVQHRLLERHRTGLATGGIERTDHTAVVVDVGRHGLGAARHDPRERDLGLALAVRITLGDHLDIAELLLEPEPGLDGRGLAREDDLLTVGVLADPAVLGRHGQRRHAARAAHRLHGRPVDTDTGRVQLDLGRADGEVGERQGSHLASGRLVVDLALDGDRHDLTRQTLGGRDTHAVLAGILAGGQDLVGQLVDTELLELRLVGLVPPLEGLVLVVRHLPDGERTGSGVLVAGLRVLLGDPQRALCLRSRQVVEVAVGPLGADLVLRTQLAELDAVTDTLAGLPAADVPVANRHLAIRLGLGRRALPRRGCSGLGTTIEHALHRLDGG